MWGWLGEEFWWLEVKCEQVGGREVNGTSTGDGDRWGMIMIKISIAN